MANTGLESSTFATFGGLLKHLRRRARLTQRELGAAVGYSETYITRLEGDARLPDPGAVRAQFVEALKLNGEPELARRLVELAEQARVARARESPAIPLPHRRTNLPAQLTRFVGREKEMAEVQRLLGTTRLLTLTGSGGCGKTRLALEVGAALAGADDRAPAAAFPDGVWLAELASLSDAGLVTDMVATALALAGSSRSAMDVLVGHLCDKQALLILDNCEHLVQACAELAEAVLRACPRLRILATSREALNIPGETTWRVPSLSAGESMQLFAECASAAQPDFAAGGLKTLAIAAICQRLDGIPLAIQLAASRLNGLSVEELAARLGDRFRLLVVGNRAALPRHQTLRAAIDWSYDLLSEPERALLRRLSVFAGGWTAEAAEATCADETSDFRLPTSDLRLLTSDIVPLLLSLVDKSLVVVGERQAETRYRLLDTIREYAWEQLAARGEADAARRRHARACLDFVRETAPRVMRQTASLLNFVLMAGSQPWLQQVEPERDNLRAALGFCLREGRDADTGIQLVLWLFNFWNVRGPHSEGREWLECALAHTDPGARTQTRAQLLSESSYFADNAGDGARAESASREALAICRELGNRFDVMNALWFRAHTVLHQGDYPQARRLIQEWLSIARDQGNAWYAGVALAWLGIMAMHQRDYPRAAALLEEGLAVVPAAEEGTRMLVQYHQGRAAWCMGDDARATALCREALAYFRQAGYYYGSGMVLHTLGDIALFQDNVEQAWQHYQEGLIILFREGARQRAVWYLAGLAALAATDRQAARAATPWAAAEAIRVPVGRPQLPIRHDAYLARVSAARAQLDERALAAAEAAGRAMSFDQVVEYALAG